MEICKNIKIRIFAFMMAFWLAFSVSYNDYQEVKALEWAIPTVAFDTALKFLLGLLGVSLTSKALHDNVDWNQVQQDAIDFQIQKGNDAVAVGEWWENVAKGTLNQASSCWSAFKEWVQTKIADNVNTDNYINFEVGSTYSACVSLFSDYFNCTIPIVNDYISYSVYSFYYYQNVGANQIQLYLIRNSDVNSFTRYNNDLRIQNSCIRLNFNVNNDGSIIYTGTTTVTNYIAFSISRLISTDIRLYIFSDLINDVLKDSGAEYTILANGSANEGIFDSANDNIQDTAITTDTPTTTAIPDTLPLPWDNVSDTAEGVDDAISGLQEQVAEGVISLEDYWERVQDLIDAMAIDTTTDEVLPTTQNPDTGENETIQDKIQENTSNDSFTLGGMEKVFPFCIPWDIYGFITLLVAPPVAPVINYPFYNPVTGQDINISIDFSDWENVVVLFRYILDFLLIIGLLLLARQLAGAGGDD